ncbi:MAG TPA: DinB family protein [Terriglobia bacterium]|nr:DinB family protein [Terriglobia bacterium]
METTPGTARTDAQEFIQASRFFLKQDFLPKLLYCLENMSDEDIWWRPNETSNSAGNLVLHLCGNLRQWIVVSLGGGTFKRDRDGEFAARGPVAKAELIAGIRSTMDEVDEVLKRLPEDRLLEYPTIQDYNASTLQAIYHVVEHFSYHLGQILYVYKLRTGMDPGFYR